MGGFCLSPSVFLCRQRVKPATPTTTPIGCRYTPAGDVHYASRYRTTLVVTASGTLVLLALVLSTLLPNAQTVPIKIGLRMVPVYTLSLHLRATLRMLFHYTPPSFTARGRRRIGLSVAWLATATFAGTLWVYTTSMATTLERSEGALAYMGIAACALLEGGLLTVWGEGLFVASQPSVHMRVQGPILGSESVLEEGAADAMRKLTRSH